MAITTRNVRIDIRNADLTPATGTVLFIRSEILRDSGDHLVIDPGTVVTAPFTAAPTTVPVPVNNDPDEAPQGWWWTICVTTERGPWEPFQAPIPLGDGSTLEFDTLVDVGEDIATPTLYALINDPRITGALQAAANLSDVDDPVEALANLGGLAAPANPSVPSVVTLATDGTPGTAPRSSVRALGRRRVGMIGDSITAGVSTYQAPGSPGTMEDASSPGTWAMLHSTRGSWDLVIQAGIGGQTSTQILARISDITSSPCDIGVVLSATWNDIGNGLTVAQSVANYTSMIGAMLAADILPVLCTPTPDGTSGTSTARKDGAERRRREIIKLGQVYGVPVIDLFTPIANAATGSIAASYLSVATDVHPNAAGQKVLGQAITDTLDRLCPGSASVGVPYSGATDDLLAGTGFFTADSNADGLADGWFADGGAGVPSIFSDPVLGNTQRITTSGNSRQLFRTSAGSMALVAGHTIELTGYISKTGTSQAMIVLNTATKFRRVTIAGTSPDITRGWYRCRWVVPEAPAVSFILFAGTGTGTCDFGRIAIRDLTALGIE